MTPEFLANTQQPFDFQHASCWTAIEIATRHDPVHARAFGMFRRHHARIMRAARHQRDLIRVFRHIYSLAGGVPRSPIGRGPAVGLAVQESGAVIVLRVDQVWIGRAIPRGTFKVPPHTVVASFEVAPWTR
jgi:hypothetical protein